MKEQQGVEGARAPPKDDSKHALGMKQESTVSASVDTGAAMEKQEVEEQRPVSPEFIMKPDSALSKVVEGVQALEG